MILGRPTNLWLGFVATLAGLVSVVAIAAGADPTIVANVVGSGVAVLGALISIVAYQPPTLNPGDPYKVTTPTGQPTADATAAAPSSPGLGGPGGPGGPGGVGGVGGVGGLGGDG